MAFFLLRLLPSMLLLLFYTKHSCANEQLNEYCTHNNSEHDFVSNLNILFKSITTNAPNNGGYYNDTVGTGLDQVYGHALCYDNFNLATCTSCLSEASHQIATECPYSKVVSYWLSAEQQCFIRYSDQSFFSVVDYNISNVLYSTNKFNNPKFDVNARNRLFDKLITNINTSANLNTSGEESVTGNEKVHGLLQCTRDLNHEDCYNCLHRYLSYINTSSDLENSMGMRIYGPSCYLHYETYQDNVNNSNPTGIVAVEGTVSSEPLLEYCSENSSNAAFKNNYDIFLKLAMNNAPNNGGYYSDTVGIGQDQMHGHTLCYADTNLTSCTSCLKSAPQEIARECPNSRVASFWLSAGQCFVRYSNEDFFSVVDNDSINLLYNSNNFTDPELGVNVRNTLFNKLINNINASVNLSASGEESVTGNGKVYGLLQCTRDLNNQDCYGCLNGYINILLNTSEVYANSTGMRIYGSSCYLHYEIFPFMPSQGGTVSKPLMKLRVTIIVAAVGAFVSLLVIISFCIWFQRKWCFSGGTKMLIEKLQEVAASEFLIYDLTTIRSATDNFSDENELGRGGFGSVYKGTLPNCQEIAVKRLSASSNQGATEFKNEVELLVRLRHNNLVKLLGCCISEHERILCYEYLPKGSLDNILFGTEDVKCKELEWSRRYKIIKGTCRGLLYLHEESPLKIVHCDLKVNNILLDKDMNPKIADFGLAKLFDRDQTHTITAHIKGTFGYIAPESSRGTFSAKSDVYSFGILVLEIVTGRKNNSFPGSLYMSGLINYVWKNWSEGKILELKDPTLDEECIEEVTKCIHVALLCLQENPSSRPRMETVFNMLNTTSIASLPPLPPARFIWGADPFALEHDENAAANSRKEHSIVGVETAMESFLSSFNRRT